MTTTKYNACIEALYSRVTCRKITPNQMLLGFLRNGANLTVA